ncbi:MAG: LysM peptidoglycan-binding domain-containing protein, partial [Tepidisphaeraceae bacterium]
PEYWYTVKEGDSLWKIATDQLGDPGAVAAIKELNKDALRGENHDVVIAGSKLRLPAKPVASVE